MKQVICVCVRVSSIKKSCFCLRSVKEEMGFLRKEQDKSTNGCTIRLYFEVFLADTTCSDVNSDGILQRLRRQLESAFVLNGENSKRDSGF